MKSLGFQLWQDGSFRGAVLLFLPLGLFLASSGVLAQTAQQTPVIDSILEVGIGTSIERAHEKLDRLSTRAKGDRDEEENEEREDGRKEAWALRGTNYTTIALKADQEGRVVWITGFVRPGKEIPFAKLGNLSSATVATVSRAVWNIATPNGGYRLIAKGQNGKARVISLLSLATPPIQ